MPRKLRIEYPGATVGMKKAEWTGGPAKARHAIEVDSGALTDGQLDLRLQPAKGATPNPASSSGGVAVVSIVRTCTGGVGLSPALDRDQILGI